MRLAINIIVCLFLIGCSNKSTPQKEVVVEPLSSFDEGQQGETFISELPQDEPKRIVIKDTIYKDCKPIYITKKIKIKDSYKVDNSEIIKLKNAVLIRDSQIDSLNIMLGKKCVGEQTNNGSKWWIFVLLGMALGGGGYQLIRTIFTKRL